MTASPAERTGPPGSLLDNRYLLGELLGVGGSASVFAADDLTASGRRVAVKLLHPELCADSETRVVFLREAEQARRIDHPNVVRVHGAGLHDAAGVVMPWIALDLLAGPTLREWVDSTGRLSPRDAAAVFDGVLSGLVAAHAAGIVHRDLSPQNIVLDGAEDRVQGRALSADMVRIVDFGLADVTGHATVGTDVLLAASSTAPARVVGNAAFMSPEQAQGLPVRTVSDLYQAGAVLYYALTGTPPFVRDSAEQVLQAHVVAPPPVPSVRESGTRAFDRIVTRAMAKTPAHRYRDAAAFRADLAEAAAGLTEADALDDSGTLDIRAFDTGDAPTRLLPDPAVSAARLDFLAPVETPEVEAGRPARSAVTGPAALLTGVVVIVIATVGVLAATANPAPAPTARPTITAAPPPPDSLPTPDPPLQAVPDPLPQPVPAQATVPTLHGTAADAEAALRAAGLALGALTRVESPEPAGRVLAQLPVAGASLPSGSTVDLTLASGSNTVPPIAGMSVAAATALLESAGFFAATDRVGATAATTVIGTQPPAGTVLRIGVSVTMTLALDEPPAPTPTPTTPPGSGDEERSS
ncbi:PASTA domain-containing protein [Salinibacterium sp. ZJ454]|uniref:protein kinase domain-containing protein n=1 Tax=Salinibacterium sp. ZJ454 TaxID=2708339 RepID=UPI00141D7634|nr:PASTA domain-containing protein [Salinibacterium sp. ZJ454]